MKDRECVHFLQWALPQLHLRWSGFRKVRRQVCKRIQHRLRELELSDVSTYQFYLATHPEEWSILDTYCRITISRFYRDRSVFNYLRQAVLPGLAQLAIARGDPELRCWSAGCASGEEVYTLKIIWNLSVLPQFPTLPLRIVATDADAHMLQRAKIGCYESGSLKELPPDWLAMAFTQSDQQYCIGSAFREGIDFYQQDIRTQMPNGQFHLVLCRNLVFTYFQETLQQEVLQRIIQRMLPGGAIAIGSHESLPPGIAQIQACADDFRIYHRI
ncbi:MAG: protein-glutamate O-methyltransferase CheR [Xenococcaceae cyanobacterium]